jgi:hypothetical protein
MQFKKFLDKILSGFENLTGLEQNINGFELRPNLKGY